MKLLLPRPQIIFPYSWDFILFLWSIGGVLPFTEIESSRPFELLSCFNYSLISHQSIRITNLPSYHTQIKNKNNILGVDPHSCGALQVNMTSLLKKNLTYHIEGLCMVHIIITYSYHGKDNIESLSISSLGSRKITTLENMRNLDEP